MPERRSGKGGECHGSAPAPGGGGRPPPGRAPVKHAPGAALNFAICLAGGILRGCFGCDGGLAARAAPAPQPGGVKKSQPIGGSWGFSMAWWDDGGLSHTFQGGPPLHPRTKVVARAMPLAEFQKAAPLGQGLRAGRARCAPHPQALQGWRDAKACLSGGFCLGFDHHHL